MKLNKIKNVGFDFDGVIHTDVSKTDKYGQRHPTIPWNSPGINKFNEIIDLIHFYHKNNYNIYIITARKSNSKDIVKQTLINFGISDIIPDNNLYFTGGDKVETLEKLKINDFYDDSISHFKSIYIHKKNNRLQNLINCYMTKPENGKILKINI